MPNDPEVPRPRTSAPVEPPRTPKDAPPRRDKADEPAPRHADDDAGVGGDRMPRGYDEPGAGL
jgi:hypothetical protein